MKKSFIAGALILGSLSFAQTTYKVDISPFPKPEKGMKQVVIEVPHSQNDANKKIEIFVGKNAETDSCNKASLAGSFKSSDLQGWGYTYLTFETNGAIATTRMACPDAKMQTRFVSSQGYLTNYNGRMPIVLYIPEGYEARFKIYTAGKDLYSAQEIQQKSK